MLPATKALISTSTAMPWTSDPIYLGQVVNYAIQLFYTSTSSVIKLQASCDKGTPLSISDPQRPNDVTHWSDISDSITTIVANGDILFDVHDAPYNWVRIVAAGNGSIESATFTTKGV